VDNSTKYRAKGAFVVQDGNYRRSSREPYQKLLDKEGYRCFAAWKRYSQYMAFWSALGSALGAGSTEEGKKKSSEKCSKGGLVVGVADDADKEAISPTSTLDQGLGRGKKDTCIDDSNDDAVSNAESDVASTDSDSEAGRVKKSTLCLHFNPTKEEFCRPFVDYVKEIFEKHPDCPCVKVTPPPGFSPSKDPVKLEDVHIGAPIKQHVFGRSGSYMAVLEEQKAMTGASYKAMATRKDRLPPTRNRNPEDSLMERSFWSSVTINPPIYGADTPMSLFDEELPWGWNLRNLGCLWNEYNVPEIAGVTTPMTYFGMWKAFFAWHKEDLDLYSINYLHSGAPKVWYCVPPSESEKFDAMARQLFPELASDCSEFIRHKNIMISPSLLRSFNINYVQALQEPGDFIVLNAQAYHAGFNLGFNCAEAVNFALEDWLDIGKECAQCDCGALCDGVSLDMSIFFPGLYDGTTSEEDSEGDSTDETSIQDSSDDDEGDDVEDDENDGEEVEEPLSIKSGKRQRAAKQGPKARQPPTKKNLRQEKAPRSKTRNLPQPISLPREASHVTWGSIVDSKPMALITKAPQGGNTFALVHRLYRPASRPDSAWFGMLEKDKDGLYVPKGETTLVQFSGENAPKLVDVDIEWTCPETRRRGAWKLKSGKIQ
jgi:hypothetical protein